MHAFAGALFLAMLVRLALLLGATPVGTMQPEILYLRSEVFRPLAWLVLVLLVLEAVQLLLPALVQADLLRTPLDALGAAVIDLLQALLLIVVAAGTLRAFKPYSRRSLAEVEVLARRSVEAVARRLRSPAPQPKARSRRGP